MILSYQLAAMDLSGIDRWTLSGSQSLNINNNGLVTSNPDLLPGQYIITVSVFDTHDNEASSHFTLAVLLSPVNPFIVGLLGEGILITVGLVSWFILRRRKHLS